jgi:hypothetical protein
LVRNKVQVALHFYTPVFKTGRIMVYHCLSVRPFHMSRSNLRTPWPIHFKFHRVIGIDGLTVCILYGEISNFHSRVVRLYSSNCRWFFVCCAVNWELLANSYDHYHDYPNFQNKNTILKCKEIYDTTQNQYIKFSFGCCS